MSAAWLAHGTATGELARSVLVLAGFGAVFALAELWHRRASPPVEWTRKLVHMLSGCLCGTFPYLFEYAVTVAGIAAVSVAALAIARRLSLVPSVTGVERPSRGEVWFPVGVALLFAAAHGQRVFYLIALATLVFADSAAALIGRAYGRLSYETGGDRKSLEGSAIFGAVTFLAVHVALLLGTRIDRAASVLVALQVALLVTSFEAISARGNDNVVVPLGAFYLLVKLAHQPAAVIALQLAAQLGWLAAMLLLAWRTRFLSLAGAVAAHLVLYAAFSLGGPEWSLAPLGALAGFVVLDARHPYAARMPSGGHQVRSIFHTSVVAVLVLFADNSLAMLRHAPESLRHGHPFQPAFIGALASPLAIVAYELEGFEPVSRRRAAWARALGAYAIALVAVLLPGLVLMGSHASMAGFALAALVPAMGLAVHLATRARLGPTDADARLPRAALITLLATAAVIALQLGAGWTHRPPR
jgi:dolichol kinase